MNSVLQDWVMNLGLRHQGLLLAGIRGCDTAPKNDPSKLLSRCFRWLTLNAFVGDATRSTSFIEAVSEEELIKRFDAVRKNLDHYPHHYVMHMIHAAAVIGYNHPDRAMRTHWQMFYLKLCHGLHMNPETEEQLNARLNATEAEFGKQQRI